MDNTLQHSDPILYFWHAIMAYFIWAWVVRNRDLGALQGQIPWAFALSAIIAACLTAVPAFNRNLGLWPHRYVRTIHGECVNHTIKSID